MIPIIRIPPITKPDKIIPPGIVVSLMSKEMNKVTDSKAKMTLTFDGLIRCFS